MPVLLSVDFDCLHVEVDGNNSYGVPSKTVTCVKVVSHNSGSKFVVEGEYAYSPKGIYLPGLGLPVSPRTAAKTDPILKYRSHIKPRTKLTTTCWPKPP